MTSSTRVAVAVLGLFAVALVPGCAHGIHFHDGNAAFGSNIRGDDETCERDGNTLVLHLTAECYVDHDLWIQIQDYATDKVLCSSEKSGKQHCALKQPIPKERPEEREAPIQPVSVLAPVSGLSSHERQILVQINGTCSDGRTRAGGSMRCWVRRAR